MVLTLLLKILKHSSEDSILYASYKQQIFSSSWPSCFDEDTSPFSLSG
uniref:Uncharacterized protein n=1 Tax=Anguilla anguilla TaxID=7936 RepID=A0A0E9QAY4_ANGAN